MNRKLEMMWKELKFWQDCLEECSNPARIEELIKNTKKNIRNYYKKKEENKDPYIVNVFRSDWDGYIEKLVLPSCEDETIEDVENFFTDFYYIPYYDRGFDCTGQLFTSLHRIFRCNGNWIIYHWVDADV